MTSHEHGATFILSEVWWCNLNYVPALELMQGCLHADSPCCRIESTFFIIRLQPLFDILDSSFLHSGGGFKIFVTTYLWVS